MAKRIDLTGQRFGRLVVLSYSHTDKGQAFWNCKCDCGNNKAIRANSLMRGKSLSCKCLNYEVSTKHGMSNSKLYTVWANMKDRCYNPNSPEYKRYGARGIKLARTWEQSFEIFRMDMEPTYQEGLTLDRIDVNGDYNRKNCRWADKITQQNNRRTTRHYTVNGVTDTFSNLCRSFKVNYELARGRMRNGWDIEKIFTTPSARKKVNSYV